MDFTFIRDNDHTLLENKTKGMNMNPREYYTVAICKPGVEVDIVVCMCIFQQCFCYISGTIELFIAHMNKNVSLEKFSSY